MANGVFKRNFKQINRLYVNLNICKEVTAITLKKTHTILDTYKMIPLQ